MSSRHCERIEFLLQLLDVYARLVALDLADCAGLFQLVFRHQVNLVLALPIPP